ncbi:MAG: autotransporter-associated beta strand repeat-containing protein, partial [Tepidisphaeraceae bacterium]
LAGNGTYSFSGVIQDSTNTGNITALTVNLAPGGTQTLSGANTYTGPTTITGGTLSLTAGGSASASTSININGGTLDVSTTTPTYTIGSTQTLLGQNPASGSAVTGPLNIDGTLSIGQVGHVSAATLTITGAVVLGSTATSNFDLFNTTGSADLLKIGSSGSGALTAGGVLDVAQASGFSGTFAAGESWDLLSFGGESGTFSTINLPTLSASLAWNTSQLYTNGTISIISTGPASLTWNNTGAASPTNGTTWDTTNNNWNNGTSATTYSDGAAVTFNDTNNGHYAVTLTSTVSPGSVTVSNSLGNYTISGTGKIVDDGFTKSGTDTLTIGVALSVGSMSISGGTLKLATGVSGGSGPAVTSPIDLTSLSITGTGVLDVNNDHVIITYGAGDPFSTIAGYIKSGYNGGGWNGPGIISSAAQIKTNGLSYGLGYADGKDGKVSGLVSGQIEVAYTLLGDANLDGLVNAADFTILAANFNQPVTGWDLGDFNYDGLVNAADFTDLAANFNQSVSGAATAGDVAALDAFAAANGLSIPTSSVPEPASTGLLTLGLVSVLARRRRKERRVK